MPQINAAFQLTAGSQDSTVGYWFIKPGDIVRGSDPLVTLNLPKKTALTLRVSPKSPLDGAILERILLDRDTPAGANEVLAVFTGALFLTETAVTQLSSPAPIVVPQPLELGVDPVFTISFSLRDTLFERYPRFHRFYFKTYPLLHIAVMWAFVLLSLLGVPLLLRALTSGSGVPDPAQGNWLLSTVETWLFPLALSGLLISTLLWCLVFFARRFSRRGRRE